MIIKAFLLNLTMFDYTIRGHIATKFPVLRSVCYKYMTLEQIVNYEKNINRG